MNECYDGMASRYNLITLSCITKSITRNRYSHRIEYTQVYEFHGRSVYRYVVIDFMQNALTPLDSGNLTQQFSSVRVVV